MNSFAQLMQDPVASQLIIWSVLLLIAGAVLTPNFRTSIAVVLAGLIGGAAILLGMRFSSPLIIGTMLGALGVICCVPPSRKDLRIIGAVFFAAAIGFYAYAVAADATAPTIAQAIEWSVFALLALTTVGSSIAMITSRSAVYSAIWFAMALLGTGGLFLYQGAQFLGVATVVVYAGAIVVTFLFVIMLAQPDGHATYDRISWGWFAKPAAALSAALLMGAVLYAVERIETGGIRETVVAAVDELNASKEPLPLTSGQVAKAWLSGDTDNPKLQLQLVADAQQVKLSSDDQSRLAKNVAERLELSGTLAIDLRPALQPTIDPQAKGHMAHLGGYLFSRHLVAVEVAGTLLLAALVGAVAMLSQGHRVGSREGDTHV